VPRVALPPSSSASLRSASGWTSSPMSPHRLRRSALQLDLRRSQCGHPDFHHGLLAWTIHEDRSEVAQSPGWWAPAGSECSEAYLRYVAGAEDRGRPPDGMNARPQ